MTYADLLKRPEWQSRRLEIIELAGHHCEECGRPIDRMLGELNCDCSGCVNGDSVPWLEVHHRFYIRNRMPWDYADDILVCLCHECHCSFTASFDVLRAIAGTLDLRQLEFVIQQTKRVVRRHLATTGKQITFDEMPLDAKSVSGPYSEYERFRDDFDGLTSKE